jgi:hypothetical protein
MQTTITLTPGDSVIVVVAPAAAPSPLPPAIWDLSLPIADMDAYLVQRCAPDGPPSVDRPDAVPQTPGDAMTWRKRDYRSDGSLGGYLRVGCGRRLRAQFFRHDLAVCALSGIQSDGRRWRRGLHQ